MGASTSSEASITPAMESQAKVFIKEKGDCSIPQPQGSDTVWVFPIFVTEDANLNPMVYGHRVNGRWQTLTSYWKISSENYSEGKPSICRQITRSMAGLIGMQNTQLLYDQMAAQMAIQETEGTAAKVAGPGILLTPDILWYTNKQAEIATITAQIGEEVKGLVKAGKLAKIVADFKLGPNALKKLAGAAAVPAVLETLSTGTMGIDLGQAEGAILEKIRNLPELHHLETMAKQLATAKRELAAGYLVASPPYNPAQLPFTIEDPDARQRILGFYPLYFAGVATKAYGWILRVTPQEIASYGSALQGGRRALETDDFWRPGASGEFKGDAKLEPRYLANAGRELARLPNDVAGRQALSLQLLQHVLSAYQMLYAAGVRKVLFDPDLKRVQETIPGPFNPSAMDNEDRSSL